MKPLQQDGYPTLNIAYRSNKHPLTLRNRFSSDCGPLAIILGSVADPSPPPTLLFIVQASNAEFALHAVLF